MGKQMMGTTRGRWGYRSLFGRNVFVYKCYAFARFLFFLIILSDIYGRKYGIVGYHMPDILGRIDGHHITVFYKVEAEFARGAKC